LSAHIDRLGIYGETGDFINSVLTLSSTAHQNRTRRFFGSQNAGRASRGTFPKGKYRKTLIQIWTRFYES